VQSQWQTLTPNDIKIPEFFKLELDVHDYVPEIYISANFHFNLFSGGFSQIGEILRFCDFFLVILYFVLGHAPRSNPGMDFHLGSYDVFSLKDGPFRGCDNIGINLEIISPKHQ